MKLLFAVTPDVLIPRPETEFLVEAAIQRLQDMEQPTVADIGTGSGAIIVSLLHYLPKARGLAVDISMAALEVARRNADRHHVMSRMSLLQGDLLEPLAGQTFDALVSNPPYIPEADIAGLSLEVRHEPKLALTAGLDGLCCYRKLIDHGYKRIRPGGFMALEVGAGQARQVSEMAVQSGRYIVSEVILDYAGISRVVVLTRKEDS